jgi:hypothetical protein
MSKHTELFVVTHAQLAKVSGGASFLADLAEDEFNLEVVRVFDYASRTNFELAGKATDVASFASRVSAYVA